MTRHPRRLLAALLLACANPAAAAPAQPTPVAHPALWRVRSGPTTIILFGTIHAWPQGGRWFAGPVAKAFAASDVLITEIPDVPPANMAALIAAKGMLPAGDSLRRRLSRPDRHRLEAALTSAGLPRDRLDLCRPWYAALSLVVLRAEQAGFDPDHGIDEALAARAKQSGERREALETAAYQLGLFAGLPEATQYRYLAQTLPALATLPRELRAMAAAWSAGDAPRLARLIDADEDTPELRTLLLTRRNHNWVAKLAARLRAGRHESLFVAVGAGHLAGPDSVIEGLRAAGFAVQRLQ